MQQHHGQRQVTHGRAFAQGQLGPIGQCKHALRKLRVQLLQLAHQRIAAGGGGGEFGSHWAGLGDQRLSLASGWSAG